MRVSARRWQKSSCERAGASSAGGNRSGLFGGAEEVAREWLGWEAELFCSPLCWSLAPQRYAADLPGPSLLLCFVSAGGEREQLVSRVLSLVFLLGTKFSLEGFSFWQTGIFEENQILRTASSVSSVLFWKSRQSRLCIPFAAIVKWCFSAMLLVLPASAQAGWLTRRE